MEQNRNYNVVFTSNLRYQPNKIVKSNLTRDEAKEFAKKLLGQAKILDRNYVKQFNIKYLSVKNNRLNKFIKS